MWRFKATTRGEAIMWKKSSLMLLGLGLAGCVLPPAVTVASYAADGILAASTGKTVTDHFVSMAEKRDCTLFRMVRGERVCKDWPDGRDPYAEMREPGEVTLAHAGEGSLQEPIGGNARLMSDVTLVSHLPDEPDAAERGYVEVAQLADGPASPLLTGEAVRRAQTQAQAQPQPQAQPQSQTPAGSGTLAAPSVTAPGTAPPARIERLEPPPPAAAAPQPAPAPRMETVKPPPRSAKPAARPDKAKAAPGKPAAKAKAKPGQGQAYVVLGSWKDEANARRVQKDHPELRTQVSPAMVNGQTFYRLTIGPVKRDRAESLSERLKGAKGFDSPFVLPAS